jgi:hypothetical protein
MVSTFLTGTPAYSWGGNWYKNLNPEISTLKIPVYLLILYIFIEFLIL